MVAPVSPLCLDSTDYCSDGRKPRFKLANEVKVVSAALGNLESYRRRPRKGKKPECLLRKVLLKNTHQASDDFIKGILNSEATSSSFTSSASDSSEQISTVSGDQPPDTEARVQEVFFAVAPCTIL